MRTTSRPYMFRVSERVTYRVFITYSGTKERPHVVSADLYSHRNEYKGCWFRSEMPKRVIREFESHLKREAIETKRK